MKKDHDSIPAVSEPASLSLSASINVDESSDIWRSKRRRTETSYGPDCVTAFLTELRDLDEINEALVYVHMIEDETKTYREVMSSIDASFWKDAINSEIESITSNTLGN